MRHARHHVRYVTAFAAVLVLAVASERSSAIGDDDQKHVLVLHMLRRDSALSIGMEDVYRRVLRGEAPDGIAVAEIDSYVIRFDWRQLQRWRIADAQLPAGSLVQFRPVMLWDQYRRQMVAGLIMLLVLGALGCALWLEHRRRQRAEMEARRYLATMADLDRRASMGHLTASLAHELRQPLGAILRNSEAAKLGPTIVRPTWGSSSAGWTRPRRDIGPSSI